MSLIRHACCSGKSLLSSDTNLEDIVSTEGQTVQVKLSCGHVFEELPLVFDMGRPSPNVAVLFLGMFP